jgi:hypothetical protein
MPRRKGKITAPHKRKGWRLRASEAGESEGNHRAVGAALRPRAYGLGPALSPGPCPKRKLR